MCLFPLFLHLWRLARHVTNWTHDGLGGLLVTYERVCALCFDGSTAMLGAGAAAPWFDVILLRKVCVWMLLAVSVIKAEQKPLRRTCCCGVLGTILFFLCWWAGLDILQRTIGRRRRRIPSNVRSMTVLRAYGTRCADR